MSSTGIVRAVILFKDKGSGDIMRRAYLKAPYKVEIRNEAIGEPGAFEAQVRVMACGVCGSDVNDAETREEFAPFGHELAGIVEKVGSAVTNVKPGDRVAMESSGFCRCCSNCRNGHTELCTDKICPPFTGFTDRMNVNARVLVPIGSLSFEEASLIEPMGVAMDLVNVADIRLNDHVVVFGAGPIGLMAIRLAKLKGAGKITVCVRSHSEKRIELAKFYGATDIVFTDRCDVKEAFKGQSVERILVTAPPAVLSDAVDIASFGCKISVIGIARKPEDSMITLDINKMHFNRLELRFSHATPALFFPLCRDLIANGLMDVKPLITHRFTIDEMDQAMKLLEHDHSTTGKVLMIADGKEQ